jgi:hypothetical protein
MNWSPPVDTGGQPLQKYTIHRSPGDLGNAEWVMDNIAPNLTTITNLPGIQSAVYFWSITASTAYGTSQPVGGQTSGGQWVPDIPTWVDPDGDGIYEPVYPEIIPPVPPGEEGGEIIPVTPVTVQDAESIQKYGGTSLVRNDRSLLPISPTAASEWANNVLEDRSKPPLIYLPLRIWPKDEAQLMQLIAIEGAQEVIFDIDTVSPPITGIGHVAGGNIQVDPDGWAAEIAVYVSPIDYAMNLQASREIAVAAFKDAFLAAIHLHSPE